MRAAPRGRVQTTRRLARLLPAIAAATLALGGRLAGAQSLAADTAALLAFKAGSDTNNDLSTWVDGGDQCGTR